jgi:tetratricopeptide (TPR) repeat protein
MHALHLAHQHWQRYEKTLATLPGWKPEEVTRARALVWYHMGRNAGDLPDEEQMRRLPAFLRDMPGRPEALKPTAEECFQRSLELAPDQLETHLALVEHHRSREKDSKAEKAAKVLLKQFPDHAPTLEVLGDLQQKNEKYAEALASYQEARRINPLERRLREKVSTAHSFHARQLAESGKFDEARAAYQAALALSNEDNYSVLCKWAMVEAKAGNAERMEELLQQALAKAGNRLAVTYSALIETIRFKLPKLKKRFDQEFKAALAEPPSAAGAVAVAQTAAVHQQAGVTYHGQKTHEKKVLAYIERAARIDFSEAQLESLCASLLVLKSRRALTRFTREGQRRYPQNPFFPYLEAESHFVQGTGMVQPWQVRPLLEHAQRLAQALPRDERQQRLLQQIQQRMEQVAALDPFARLFGGGSPFEAFFGFDDDDEDDYDDDDW